MNNMLFNGKILKFVLYFFLRNVLNTGLIILLWDVIDLFHNFLVLPFASLDGNVLNVILIIDVFASVRYVGFTALGLEWGRFMCWLVYD